MKRYGATPRHRDAVGGVDPGHPRGITGQMIQMQGPFYEDVVGVGFPHPNPMSFELAVTQAESVAQVRLECNNILYKSPYRVVCILMVYTIKGDATVEIRRSTSVDAPLPLLQRVGQECYV